MASGWGNQLNLDPDSYTMDEIYGLLGVRPGSSRAAIVEARETLARQLRAVGGAGVADHGDISLFLDTVTGRLLSSLPEPTKSLVSSGAEGTWGQRWTPVTQHGSNVLITSPDAIAGRDASSKHPKE